MGCNKNSSKREIYSNTILPQETRKTLNRQLSSVQFSRSVVSDSLRHHELQHARPPCPSPTPGVYSNIELVMPSNHLILYRPLLLLPSIFPSIRFFSNKSALAWGGQSIWVSASTSVLPMNTQDLSPLGWTGWISLQEIQESPRDSQESSPTPQFKGINSLVLSFLYSPTLTSIHDYWKNHSLD